MYVATKMFYCLFIYSLFIYLFLIQNPLYVLSVTHINISGLHYTRTRNLFLLSSSHYIYELNLIIFSK